VTATGKDAVQQMMKSEKALRDGIKVYPHRIDMNALPHIERFPR